MAAARAWPIDHCRRFEVQASSSDRWMAGRNSRKDMPKEEIEENGLAGIAGEAGTDAAWTGS